MVIQIDTRQQMNKKHHQIKEQWFLDHGHTVIRSKCLVGDYVCPSDGSIAVDTKQSMTEMYNNLIQDHVRFRNECIKAKECGIQLIVLVENNQGMTKLADVLSWYDPRYSEYRKRVNRALREGKEPPKEPASNISLYRIMDTMQKKYNVKFMFCSTEEAGAKIVELLGGNNEN